MNEWIIHECSEKLKGTLKPSGNKNEALPAICAALLADDIVNLEYVPDILDVKDILSVLESIGAGIVFNENLCRITPLNAYDLKEMNIEAAKRIRASFLLAGALLAKHKKVFLPFPGGDRIGTRPLNVHLDLFVKLGIKTDFSTEGIHMQWEKAKNVDYLFLDEPSVMGTENILMLISRTERRIIIENAATEPHVQGLCRMLCSMGCQIDGIGSSRLSVKGCKNLKGTTHRISYDHIEIGSFISLAIATRSALKINYDRLEHIRPILNVYKWLGADVLMGKDHISVPEKDEHIISPPPGIDILKISDGPWPMFPSDLLSTVIVAATQCTGNVLFFEKMFESRLYFVDELIRMGARIIHCDPHRVITMGPSSLRGTFISSPDIRAGYGLLIAALCAKGTTALSNIRTISRGYENVLAKLKRLGAIIEEKP